MEVLIAATLMAIVVAVIVGGMATILSTSRVHRSQADSGSVLVSAMERLKSSDVQRVPCATPSTASYVAATQGASLPSGWSSGAVSISSIQYETMANVNGVPGVSYGTVCNDNGTSGLTLQLIKIKITSPDGRVTPSLSFVKGDNS